MKPEIEVERRAGMITGASCGHTSLTWLPSAGRHGVRTWVLSTADGGTIRRIRLSPGEIGCLAGILQTIAIREAAMTNPLDEDAVPLILDEPKHGKGRGISMTIRFTYALHVGTGLITEGLN